jgi:hypothetical protein
MTFRARLERGRSSIPVLFVAVAALSAIASCILADAAPALPKPPSLRPTIVKGSVFPSASEPVGDLPAEFLVPVELADPTKPFEWKVFVDFDPLGNADDFVEQRGGNAGSVTAPNLQVVPFSVNKDRLAGGCHRIEFVVALRFDSARASDPLLSDSVTWFYTPTGNLAGCTTYDGGPGNDGAFPADAAGADGGTE